MPILFFSYEFVFYFPTPKCANKQLMGSVTLSLKATGNLNFITILQDKLMKTVSGQGL